MKSLVRLLGAATIAALALLLLMSYLNASRGYSTEIRSPSTIGAITSIPN